VGAPLHRDSNGCSSSNDASASEYGAAGGRFLIWLVAKSNEFSKARRTAGDVFQARIGELYGIAVADKLFKESFAGTPNSVRVGVVIQGRLFEEVQNRAFLFWR
jgi:hypothetical protein